jgi:SAM-dependent methyltransferase
MAPSFDYQTIEIGYYDHIFHKRSGPQSKWHWQKFEVIRDLLYQSVPAGSSLLDIACGPGTFLGLLNDSVQATGVDIAAPQIAYATQHYAAPRKQFQLIAPGPLPFPDNSFDAVTSIELIEHLTPDLVSTVLSEARRVLKPGGILILSTPNYHSGWPVLEALLNRLSALSYADQHINKFHRSRLEQALQQVGFAPAKIHVQPYQGLAPFGAFLSWSFADQLLRLEQAGPAHLYGFLLLGTARK